MPALTFCDVAEISGWAMHGRASPWSRWWPARCWPSRRRGEHLVGLGAAVAAARRGQEEEAGQGVPPPRIHSDVTPGTLGNSNGAASGRCRKSAVTVTACSGPEGNHCSSVGELGGMLGVARPGTTVRVTVIR